MVLYQILDNLNAPILECILVTVHIIHALANFKPSTIFYIVKDKIVIKPIFGLAQPTVIR